MTKRMKTLLVSCSFLMLALALAALVSLVSRVRPAPSVRTADQTVFAEGNAPEEVGVPGEESAFVLRDFGGFIAVYRLPESDGPDLVTGIDTRTLRRADYLALQAGIPVEGWENLQKALEDFGP